MQIGRRTLKASQGHAEQQHHTDHALAPSDLRQIDSRRAAMMGNWGLHGQPRDNLSRAGIWESNDHVKDLCLYSSKSVPVISRRTVGSNDGECMLRPHKRNFLRSPVRVELTSSLINIALSQTQDRSKLKMSSKYKMPTTKPVDTVTLYPVNKNGKKRSRDEMSASPPAAEDQENSKKRSRDDMSPSPPPEDDEESVDNSADDAATSRPQDLSNRNSGGGQEGSVVGGGPATLPVPRRMSAPADTHLRPHHQASTAVPHVAPRTHAPPVGARQQGQGQGFVDPPPVCPVVPQAPAYNLHQQVQQPDDYASIVGLRTQIIGKPPLPPYNPQTG